MNNIQLIGYLTMVKKEFRRFIKIWGQTILPAVVTTGLYFLIFGQFLGSNMNIQNFDYVAFIAPGLIIMVVINNSFANVVSSFFQAKMMKSLEEILVSPMNSTTIIAGYVTGGLARGLINGLAVSIVASFFTQINIQNWFFVIGFGILTSLFFSLAGLLNGIFAKNFDDVNIIPTFILQPMVYLGGVFYSIHTLPHFWQLVSKFNPILYIVDGFRYGFLGHSDMNPYNSLMILGLISVILWFVCWNLIEKGTRIRN